MKIKQITNYPVDSLPGGSVVEWNDAEATRMMAAGLVEPIEQDDLPVRFEPPIERATLKPKFETRRR